ncbi:hypothetical protein E2C01_029185 [Portunus trituberculatus]|uniref:Uncharacterized protein n=1 Tax=Portunus trituberculatus TaxID=210409 RepID=A0A5B7ERK4_PORTR|nr:hypothetical protein [Portunus trituberculatus]
MGVLSRPEGEIMTGRCCPSVIKTLLAAHPDMQSRCLGTEIGLLLGWIVAAELPHGMLTRCSRISLAWAAACVAVRSLAPAEGVVRYPVPDTKNIASQGCFPTHTSTSG